MGAGFGARWGMRRRWGGWSDCEAEAVLLKIENTPTYAFR